MKFLRFLVRFVIYVMILFPLLSRILGGEWWSKIIAFIILALVGSILEVRGIMKKLVDAILGLFGGVMKEQNNTGTDNTSTNNMIEGNKVECPNCGAIVSPKNGKCDSCGSPL